MDKEQTGRTAKTARPLSPEHRQKLSNAMKGNSNARKPEAIKTAVIVKKVQGESNLQIAHDLDINPATVSGILKDAEISEKVKEGRSDCFRLIPQAVAAVKSGLDKRDWRAGHAVLRGTGVFTSGTTVNLTQVNVAAHNWCVMREAKLREEGRIIEADRYKAAIEASSTTPATETATAVDPAESKD